MRHVSSLLLFLLGCAAYDRTPSGTLTGSVYLAWIGPDRFLYIRSQSDPLTFRRHGSSEPISPDSFYTDGGSIPRLAWAHPEYSPWRFAPAYIVHDWLFVAHRRGLLDGWTVYDAADVMMEAVKTAMESDPKLRGRTTFNVLRAGVRSRIARRLWERRGVSDTLDADAVLIADKLGKQLDANRGSDALMLSYLEWRKLSGLPSRAGIRGDTAVMIPVLRITPP